MQVPPLISVGRKELIIMKNKYYFVPKGLSITYIVLSMFYSFLITICFLADEITSTIIVMTSLMSVATLITLSFGIFSFFLRIEFNHEKNELKIIYPSLISKINYDNIERIEIDEHDGIVIDFTIQTDSITRKIKYRKYINTTITQVKKEEILSLKEDLHKTGKVAEAGTQNSENLFVKNPYNKILEEQVETREYPVSSIAGSSVYFRLSLINAVLAIVFYKSIPVLIYFIVASLTLSIVGIKKCLRKMIVDFDNRLVIVPVGIMGNKKLSFDEITKIRLVIYEKKKTEFQITIYTNNDLNNVRYNVSKIKKSTDKAIEKANNLKKDILIIGGEKVEVIRHTIV